ncbi:lysine-specific histone demethylase 1 homolog 3 [Impatiens glandulifera]|uniref:lysine-specific histone demethylase 1 homolog 3 n=1 Tax=Impatiens glandulifera TaxID=253017 RepID=UPI001FB0BD12|nr:lysine-specific histone demethylase 1 homolog 3 [Impatiens glandulifera]XP_047341150.1 lysine-specific histone demethylase 1 homolog 3 [Impatiens glandulifera]
MSSEEKKTGPKKRSNLNEAGINSEDDEPIGALIKLKNRKTLKKVKTDGSDDKGKGIVEEDKLVAAKEDLGGMDDTLAIFRKKLKRPKKDNKSGIKSGNCKSADAEELYGKVFTDPAENILEVSEDDKGSISQSKGQSASNNGKKSKIKRSKAAHKLKKGEINACLLSCLDEQGSHNSSKEVSKPHALKSSGEFRTPSIDSLEVSLSSMSMKVQGVKARCHLGPLEEQESKALIGTSSELFVDVKPVGATISGDIDMDRRMGEDDLAIDTGEEKNNSTSCHNEVQINRDICDKSVDNMLGGQSCIITNSSITAYVGKDDKVHGLKSESEGLQSLDEDFDNVKTDNPCLNLEHIPECIKLKGALELNGSEHNLLEMSCSGYTSRQVEQANQSDENAPILGVGDALTMKSKQFSSMSLKDSSGRASQEVCANGDSLAIVEKVVNKLKFHPSQKAPLKPKLLSSCSAFGRDKKEECLSDYDGSNKRQILCDPHILETERREIELDIDQVPGIKQFYSQKDDASVCTVHQNQPSDQVLGPTFALSDEGSVEATGNSSPSNTPDIIGVVLDEKLHMPNTKRGNSKKSSVQRTARKIKKRRHGDMAYEGDADWEMLINGYGFFENRHVEGGQPTRRRHKSNLPSGVVAAVSAGLKARAADPIEKIKFKEVFKRKGGLQEYLECRNHILDLWSKNLNSFLSLEDCGVIDVPFTNEPPNVSLVREIYMFLDKYGFINFGVASGKGRGETLKILKILHEKSKKVSSDQVANLDDGASAIPVPSLEVNNDDVFNDERRAAGALKEGIQIPEQINELPSQRRSDASQDDEIDVSSCPDKVIGTMLNMDAPTTDKWNEELTKRVVPVISSNDEHLFDEAKSVPNHHFEGSMTSQNDSKEKRRIIVIGAGPAGLSAARHLQRQGYSVDILEARNRIGGRVYTDFSSLSVPVDLGASIITGVEADVATERRPDPSSLVCAQLGLELTVLNSDCPLFDIVTGRRVPTDLDEALESEYNSLLDDMVLLIAHKRDQAMRMSLEDGLDYVLKRRRFGRNQVEKLMVSAADPSSESDKFNVESYVAENNGSKEEILSPLEKRVMDWHFAHLEYGCAAPLNQVSLPHWNQDDAYGGFGGAHCMIKGGYSSVVEALSDDLNIHLNNVVEDISYFPNGCKDKLGDKVKVVTSAGREFSGDAVLITVPLGCLKAKTINFLPPLPDWKQSSIQRLGFGVLNKVVLEFPEVFWDDSVDYFGATAEGTNERGHCFMFWNVKKTVGAPVLISLVVGKAAIDGQNNDPSDHVNRALTVLRKLFGEASVPDPVAFVVTDWGRDPFSYGAYSYVAIGASGEDYDILGRPVENCLFFAGEATCKEHPDTVGGAMLSGLREAVRIIDILSSGNDYTAEVEAMEASQRQIDSEKNEVRDLVRRLDSVELSNALYKKSLDGEQIFTRGTLLQDMFCNAKTTAGRLHLAKELLKLPIDALKAFAGTKEGLGILNSWILDSMGKDGTQLLRHCVRLLVLVSTDLGAVRLSGIGRTVKEKVCVHTSRDIRAIASQLVNVWIEVFRKEKASNGGLKLLRQTASVDSSKNKSSLASAKARSPCLQVSTSDGTPSNADNKSVKPAAKLEKADTQLEVNPSKSQSSSSRQDTKEDGNIVMSEEERAAIEAAEAAKAKAVAAAEAYASAEAKRNASMPLPKILSFHKFARREQYAQMDESEFKRKWPGGALGRQDCLSEIDSRNCKVRDWSVDFSAACPNLDSSKMLAKDPSKRSHSNDLSRHPNLREHSAESAAADISTFTKSWIDASGSVEAKDNDAIERWQSQAAAAGADLHSQEMQVRDEEESNLSSKLPTWKHKGLANESSVSQVTLNKELVGNQPKEPDRIKQAVVDYVASLLMPLYKAKKISRESYKSIMKKAATKVMEQATDADKAMAVHEFLDFKCKNKIRVFVDLLIAKHMGSKPTANS